MHNFHGISKKKKKNPWNDMFMFLRRTVGGKKVRNIMNHHNEHNSQSNLKEQGYITLNGSCARV